MSCFTIHQVASLILIMVAARCGNVARQTGNRIPMQDDATTAVPPSFLARIAAMIYESLLVPRSYSLPRCPSFTWSAMRKPAGGIICFSCICSEFCSPISARSGAAAGRRWR